MTTLLNPIPRKIFISAGHSNVSGRDRGALGVNGTIEGELTVALRKKVVSELNRLGTIPITDSDNTVTRETVAFMTKTLTSRDIAIDIHFNASVKSATGTEVLIPFKSSEFERHLGNLLSYNIATVLGIRNRGLKTEADSARGRLIFMTPNCENILIEVCFITNENDMKAYNEKQNQVATIIAKCIISSLNK
jgi:N-acetylmuramoyl-L-alanine amidase